MVVAAVIGGTVAVGSAYMQSEAAKDAAQAQKESTAAQQKIASANAARERLKQIREARLRASAISAEAGSAGIGQASSGVAGSISSIGSQTGSNIGAINVTEGFAEIASQANQRAADAQAKQMKWQAIGNIGQTIFSQATARIK